MGHVEPDPIFSPGEARLYDDLRHERVGPALRLEQERIGFARVEAALALLGKGEEAGPP